MSSAVLRSMTVVSLAATGLMLTDGFGAVHAAAENGMDTGPSISSSTNIRIAQVKTLPQIRQELQARGFSKIEFTDRALPRYKATACKNERKFNLVLNRFGAIRKQQRIGDCVEKFIPPRSRAILQVPPRNQVRTPPEVRLILKDQGFYDIEFTDRKLPGYRALACRNNKRFNLLINRFGKISKAHHQGPCAAPAGRRNAARNITRKPREIRGLLKDQGYYYIEFTDTKLPGYWAFACRANKQYNLLIDRFGHITKAHFQGNCSPLSNDPASTRNVLRRPPEIRKRLRYEGYSKIEFTDTKLPGYWALACRNNTRFKLLINRYGKITKTYRQGRCSGKKPVRDSTGWRDQALKPAAVRQVLRNKGFTEIVLTDKQLPVYIAEACNINGNRMELRLNRYGEIRRRDRIGLCRTGAGFGQSPKKFWNRDIRERLQRRGFNRITFIDRRLPPSRVEACRNGRRFDIRLNTFGQVTRARPTGACRVQAAKSGYSLPEIRQALENRGYYSLRFTDRRLPGYKATACRRGNKFSLTLNRWGEIKKRKRSGWCGTVKRQDLRFAPRIRFAISELRNRDRVTGDICQDYFDALVSDTKIHFAVGSSRISDSSYDLLDRMAGVAKRCPGAQIEVAGHTDSDGSFSANQRLSEERAFAVADYLASRGVRKRRIAPVGYGERHPLAPNNTAYNKALNRRIDFIVNWDEG